MINRVIGRGGGAILLLCLFYISIVIKAHSFYLPINTKGILSELFG